MSLRKVLLVTYHFPPSGAVAVYRMLGLIRHLPRYGWQPIVIAPPRLPWEPEDASLMAQVPPGTAIEIVPFASSWFGRIERYFAPEAHWLYRAWPVCKRRIQSDQPAAVITSSPPGSVHRVGLWIKAKYRLPWLACFRDPWITNRNVEKWTLQMRVERAIERNVMDQADVLIANTPLNQQGWAAAYPAAAHKIVTIPNGFDPERFAPSAPPREAGALVTILHAGELYTGRDPRPFLDALAAANLAF